MKHNESSDKDNNTESSSHLDARVHLNAALKTSSIPIPNNRSMQQGSVSYPVQFPPMFFNPFLSQAPVIVPPNFNYLGNQGIFIPQAAEKNQFFFIPGSIIDNEIKDGIIHNNISDKSEQFESRSEGVPIQCSSATRTTKESIYFVPRLDQRNENIKEDIRNEFDDFETYLVPVKLKKENNGNIELLPENQIDDQPQPTNPEQISILQKINRLKNQQITKGISETIENKVTGGQAIIDNINDKTQGYVMVRFNKEHTAPTEKSLMISAAEKGKITYEDLKKEKKGKKNKKNHKLKLSAVSDKLISTSQSTSRFRRLRITDRTQCWNVDGVTCIETRVKELPSHIISLSQTNAINIPDGIFSLFKQTDIKNKMDSKSTVTCEHLTAKESGDKNKLFDKREVQSRFSFWRYMCSMNNCEFTSSEKSFI